MKDQKKSILEMARGAILERVDEEVKRVIVNIMDEETIASAKRKVVVTVEFKPDTVRMEERRTKSPCKACGYEGKHLDAPPCTSCPAHPKKPTHIDREALHGSWEGEADGYSAGELVYDVWRCGDCGHVEETDDPDLLPRFCPSCGRAMTPEAQAELEKRLRG